MNTVLNIVIYAGVAYLFMYLTGVLLDYTGLSANFSGNTKTLVTIGIGAAATWLLKDFIDDKLITPLSATISGNDAE